jgi:UDP-N-acetylglucosamine transferase subunit ALG13
MILVTVGTEPRPFNRLMQWISALISCEFLVECEEELVVQYGSCTVLPSGARVYPQLPDHRLRPLLKEARLVISHCDEAMIHLLKDLSTPYILVPRTQELAETDDNYQLALAIALARTGVPIAWSPGDLVRFLAAPERVSLKMVPSATIGDLCNKLENHRRGSSSVKPPNPSHSLS